MSASNPFAAIVDAVKAFTDGLPSALGAHSASAEQRAHVAVKKHPVKRKKKKQQKKPVVLACTPEKPKPAKKGKQAKKKKLTLKAVRRGHAKRTKPKKRQPACAPPKPAATIASASGGSTANGSGSTNSGGSTAGSGGSTAGGGGSGGTGSGGYPPGDWVPPTGTLYFPPSGSSGGDTGWVNVMAYGAKGDGIGDDTAALNAACDAARQINVDGGVTVVYLPTGTYNVSGTINVFDVFLRGDGMGASKIQAASDWAGSPNTSWVLDQQPSTNGVGKPATSASGTGPAPQAGTWIEDVWVSGPGSITAGKIPCNLSGIRVGTGAGYGRVRVEGFFAGAFLFSSEEKILGPGKQGGNYYGIYYGEPSPSARGQLISDIEIDGCAWASIGISSGNALQVATLRSMLLGPSPFGIYKEEAPSGGVALSGCLLSNVRFDSCGNGNIFVNGPASGGGDIEGCLFQATRSSNVFDPSTAVSISTTDARGRAIGRTLAPIDLLGGSWTDNEVQVSDPAYVGANNSNYSAIVACGEFTGGRYGPAQTAIAQVVSDGKRFTTGNSTGDSLVINVGTTCRVLPAAANGILSSDLVEASTGSHLGAQRSTGSRRALGVAMHRASSGDSVPVAYSGMVIINCGTNSISPDDPLKADPTQAGCVVTASLTDPGLIGVAQQASSNGTVQTLLQAF
jgi:hypothetical protein